MSAPQPIPFAAWHISSFSADGGGDCVEAGPLTDHTPRIAVRHSKHPNGPTLIYTQAEWKAFISGVRSGEFDFFPNS